MMFRLLLLVLLTAFAVEGTSEELRQPTRNEQLAAFNSAYALHEKLTLDNKELATQLAGLARQHAALTKINTEHAKQLAAVTMNNTKLAKQFAALSLRNTKLAKQFAAAVALKIELAKKFKSNKNKQPPPGAETLAGTQCSL
jgi:hypothetical protein